MPIEYTSIKATLLSVFSDTSSSPTVGAKHIRPRPRFGCHSCLCTEQLLSSVPRARSVNLRAPQPPKARPTVFSMAVPHVSAHGNGVEVLLKNVYSNLITCVRNVLALFATVMELFFFRHAEYDRLYNCTGLEINSIPLERRQFVPESIAVCVLCVIYYVLYVPCMCSLWKHMRDNSCYKLLFYIGITDLAILWIPGFFCGLANLCGAVFCSCPTLMYFVGVLALALWVAESSADLILAFNRCLDLVSPRFSHILFSGPRTSLWITGCSLYALYWVFFMKPIVYSKFTSAGSSIHLLAIAPVMINKSTNNGCTECITLPWHF
uniref:Uncharacterized protein n=1 Tax=Globodera rostochiensis TaxID=31243 RepID=A0A914I6H1_GLORO